MSSMWCTRLAASGALLLATVLQVATLLVATSAAALPATFDAGGDGFNSTNLDTLPLLQFAEPETPFLLAGDPVAFPTVDIGLAGSGGFDICILPGGSNVCAPDTTTVDGTGAYSVLVTLDVSVMSSLAMAEIDGPFTVFLSGLVTPTDDPVNGYDPSEVSVELSPTAPAGLDTSAVPGFAFGGTFDSFVHVEDSTFAPFIYDFVGWTVVDGDSITYRIDINSDSDGRPAPALLAGAIPLAIPEPGTALLMGLGLVGLAVGGGRRRPEREGKND